MSLTIGQLKSLIKLMPDDGIVTVCGSNDIMVRFDNPSRINPYLLEFDAGDIDPYAWCDDEAERKEIEARILHRD